MGDLAFVLRVIIMIMVIVNGAAAAFGVWPAGLHVVGLALLVVVWLILLSHTPPH